MSVNTCIMEYSSSGIANTCMQIWQKTLAKDLKSFLATLGDLGKAYGADIEEDLEPEEASADEEDEEDGGSSSAEDGPAAEVASDDSDEVEEQAEEETVNVVEQPVVSAKPVKEATTATVQENGHVSRSGMVGPEFQDRHACSGLMKIYTSSLTQTLDGTIANCQTSLQLQQTSHLSQQRRSSSFRLAGLSSSPRLAKPSLEVYNRIHRTRNPPKTIS